MKKAKRFRLTKAAKILIMVLIVALIGGGIFAGVQTGVIQTKKNKKESIVAKTGNTNTNKENSVNKDNKTADDDTTINLSLDEWIGWKSIIDANGGLTTQSGSIYDKLGVKVNINVINDATQSSNALIKGDLNAAGYTINRTAFLSKKFTDAGKEVVMPYITNYSINYKRHDVEYMQKLYLKYKMELPYRLRMELYYVSHPKEIKKAS